MKKSLYLSLVALVVVASGCQWYTSTTAGPSIEIEVTVNESADGYTVDGQILHYASDEDLQTFENASIYLYDTNQTLIRSVSTGTWTGESPPFSIQTPHVPEYIIIYSNEFWGLDELEVQYLIRSEADRQQPVYTVYYATSKDDLPIVPGTEMNSTTSGS